MPSNAPTAFFSYSREDSEFALRLAEDLKAAGASVWLDQLDIAPGQRWARAVQEALNNAERVLVILSPSSAESTHVEDEVNYALEEHKAVIPVFHKDCKVPFQLRPFQYVDFRTDYAHGLNTMLKTLSAGKAVGTTSASAAAAVMQEQPASTAKTAVEPDRVTVLTHQAYEGNAQAMAELGCIYGTGEGVRKNPKQSYLWYRKAAEAGDVGGMFNLALIYSTDGELKDERKAVDWYRRAAEAGDRDSMFNLANAYEHGKGIERDYKEAMKWYGRAERREVEGAEEALQRVTCLQEESEKAIERERLEQERKGAEQARLEQEERDRQAAAERAPQEEEERARQKQESKAAAEKSRVEQQKREQQAAAEQARLAEEKRARQEQENKAAAEKGRLEQQEREQQDAAKKARLERQEWERLAAQRDELTETPSPERSASRSLLRSVVFPDSAWGKALAVGIFWTMWDFCVNLFLEKLRYVWNWYSSGFGRITISFFFGSGLGLIVAVYLGWMKPRHRWSYGVGLVATWATAGALGSMVWWLGWKFPVALTVLRGFIIGALTAVLLRRAKRLLTSAQFFITILGYVAAMIVSRWVSTFEVRLNLSSFIPSADVLVEGLIGAGVMFWQISKPVPEQTTSDD